MMTKNSSIIKNAFRFSVAPMLDCTDKHFRVLMRQITKRSLLYTEMVVAKAIHHSSNRSSLLDFNEIEHQITWVSYLPSITQVEKLTRKLYKNNFENIEVKEILERSWIVKDKILRPMNEMVGHTGFIVSGRIIS